MDATTTLAAAPATAARAGYDPGPAETARRVRPMLEHERVVWLSTVHPDGRPHIVPTWFWWDGAALVFWSKPEAVKVRNIRSEPRLMVALGDADADFSVGLIEARGELVSMAVPGGFFAKYAGELAAAGLDAAGFRALYTQAVRVVPTRFLAWHGRGPVRGAAAVPGHVGGFGIAAGAAAVVAGWLAQRLDRWSARLRGGVPAPLAAG